jgi:hypothetical protein
MKGGEPGGGFAPQVVAFEREPCDWQPQRAISERPSHPPSIIGNESLLRIDLTAILTSIRIPADLVLPSFDAMLRLRAARTALVGGFQTPLEKEWLRLLLRGEGCVVVYLPRSLQNLRISPELAKAIERGRLALVSTTPAGRRRSGARESIARNREVVALARRVLVVHARPGSRAYRAAAAALEAGREVYCLEHPRNSDLALVGTRCVSVRRLPGVLRLASPAFRS